MRVVYTILILNIGVGTVIGMCGCCSGDYCDWDGALITSDKNMENCLASIRGLVEGLKKGRKVCFGEDQTSDKIKGYNQAIKDVLKEMGS